MDESSFVTKNMSPRGTSTDILSKFKGLQCEVFGLGIVSYNYFYLFSSD